MNFKTNFKRYAVLSLSVFLLSLGVTIILCSNSIKISFGESRKQIGDYYDYNPEENGTYEDYIEAKYRSTIEYIDNIIYIKNKVERLNKEQYIFNQDKFGPMRPTTFVFVIQVRDNPTLLNVLIESLRKVMGISNSLLIFCHHYYDNNINTLVQNIDFTKYIQIFYPYSNQLFPKMFPGNDRKFCSGDFNCTDLCVDMEVCLRNYLLVQQKHFWWWQLNFVFDHLEVMQNHDEFIVFLEENQYVLNDILFMLKVLVTLLSESYPQCEIISFGARAPAWSQFHIENGRVTIEHWDPAFPNIGFAFNRSIWQTIKNNSYHFCHFDDYRWDMSLNYLASKRPQGPFTMLSSDAPRVLRINFCDGTIPDCTMKKCIDDVQRFVDLVHRGLYPRNLIISSDDKAVGNISSGGEWKDVRDSALCMYFTHTLV